jgi:uncharacterized protein (TIGR03066 family)
MYALRLLVAGVAMLVLTAGASADDKKDTAKLIVGKWEVTKSFDQGPPVGAAVEFTKDGKFKAIIKADEKEVVREGTYKVDGDKVELVIKAGDKENKTTFKVKKISDTEMVTENDEGKSVELKHKK